MPFQGRKIDGVGEVRGEQLTALGFEFGPVCHEVSNLLVTVGHVLVECRIHLLSEVAVGLSLIVIEAQESATRRSATATGTARRVQMVFLAARPEHAK